MLTLIEKILFVLAALASTYAALRVADRLIRIISRGHGKPDWDLARQRLLGVLAKTLTLQPTFKLHLGPSLFHAFIAWGFIYYLLVNLGDVLEGYLPGFHFLGQGAIGNFYRLLADLLSVGVLLGMTAMLVRRFVFKPTVLSARDDILLQSQSPHRQRKLDASRSVLC